MKDIKDILASKAAIITKTLKNIMDTEPVVAHTLREAMEYTLFSGGKRIRPVLTLMVAEMLGGNTRVALRAGAAIEMIHTYSLIHDDLPSMDDDDYRRGQPTSHKVYGSGIAILAGDGLLTFAFNILSRLQLPANIKIKIIQIISRDAGVQGMVAGQVLDLEGENKKLDIKELQKIHENKTGALFNSSILTGAYCGEADSHQIAHLQKFASQLGLLFQIIDDILDVTGNQGKLGKRVGSDDKLNKATYPGLLGLESARQQAEKTAATARNALDIFGEKADLLRELVDFVHKRDK